MGGFFSQLFGFQTSEAKHENFDNDVSDDQDMETDNQDIEQIIPKIIGDAEEYLEDADATKPTIKMAECACIGDNVNFLKKMEENNFTQWNNPKLIRKSIIFGSIESSKFLLERGADANTIIMDEEINSFDGRPLLTAVTMVENAEMCKFLLSKGANINAVDENGFTALIYAAASGNLEICKILISEGADVNANGDGVTALDCAKSEGHTEVVKLLKSSGARS